MGHEAGPLTNGHDKARHLPACAVCDRGKLPCTRSCGRSHTSHILVRTRARDDATEWPGARKIGAGEYVDTCGVAFIRPPKKTPALFTQAFPWPRYRAPMNDFSSASTSGAGFRAAPFQYRTRSGISKSVKLAFSLFANETGLHKPLRFAVGPSLVRIILFPRVACRIAADRNIANKFASGSFAESCSSDQHLRRFCGFSGKPQALAVEAKL